MAIYQYRCRTHGVFDAFHRMGGAPPQQPCPSCRLAAARVYSAALLAAQARSRMDGIERTERSREQPAVVSAPPPGPQRRGGISTDPRHRHLPRP